MVIMALNLISLLDPSTTKHQMMFYDIKTNDYVFVSSSSLSSVSENLIFIAAIDLINFKVFAQGNYTVNSVFNRVKSYEFSPEELIGDYEPISAEATNGTVSGGFDASTVMAQDIYNAYDSLMASYPGYITRELIGYDSAGVLPIYAYKFTPQQSQRSYISGTYKPYPKVIVGSAIHGNGQTDAGDRETTVFALYYFLKDICENWSQSELLEYLRWNVRFIVVPVQNPWGFNNRSRRNENLVDLSRNYDYAWTPTVGGNVGDNTYGGPSAFSESESRAMRDLILANSDAIHLIDLHSRGGLPTDDQLIMFDMTINNELYYSAEYHIGKLSRKWKNRSYGLNDLTHYGTIYDSIIAAGKVHGWGTNIAGIPSIVVEGFANRSSGTLTTNGIEVMTMNTELIGNWILYVLKYFKRK
jgi:Zinc carboxypeptidase